MANTISSTVRADSSIMINIFLICFIVGFFVAIASVIVGVVFKYKESKAIREAAMIKAEADKETAKLRGAAEVQQAVNRKEDSLTMGLLRAALGKMNPEDAAALIQGLHTNAQSVGAQSVEAFQNATMDEEALDALIYDLTSGIGQNVQADANQQF